MLIEALDQNGYFYTREANLVAELPHLMRHSALIDLAANLSTVLEMPIDHICFGIPLYQSIGLSYKEAKLHPRKELLFTKGCDLPLT